MKYVNLNGKLLNAENAGHVFDNRAFRYGYGLFETILVQNSTVMLKEQHAERLFMGMKQLNFDMPAQYSNIWLEDEILKAVRKNNMEKLCRIRLQVYAGSGGMFDQDNQQPQFLIECFPLEPHSIRLNETGLQAGIAQDLAKSPDSIANLKSCNALIYVLAAQQAKANKWNDALIKNTAGNVIESTIANLFLVKDKIIYTPPLQEGCISGIMRAHIISTLAKHNIEVLTKSITEEDIYNADELFLSNAIKRIKWISCIGNKTYQNSYTQHIYSLLFGIE